MRKPTNSDLKGASPPRLLRNENCMTDILSKTIVLVLNRHWQAINIRTLQEAFCQMATGVATALDIKGESHICPVTWDEWITLPVLPVERGPAPSEAPPGAIRGTKRVVGGLVVGELHGLVVPLELLPGETNGNETEQSDLGERAAVSKV